MGGKIHSLISGNLCSLRFLALLTQGVYEAPLGSVLLNVIFVVIFKFNFPSFVLFQIVGRSAPCYSILIRCSVLSRVHVETLKHHMSWFKIHKGINNKKLKYTRTYNDCHKITARNKGNEMSDISDGWLQKFTRRMKKILGNI